MDISQAPLPSNKTRYACFIAPFKTTLMQCTYYSSVGEAFPPMNISRGSLLSNKVHYTPSILLSKTNRCSRSAGYPYTCLKWYFAFGLGLRSADL